MNYYQQLFKLNGKIAVVTVAAGILGSEFCKALYGCGATVVCIDANSENLKKLEAEIIKEYDISKFVFL